MVGIKGMEMPSCCLWDCSLAREDGGACQLADVRTSDKERPKDCPLVEIVTCKDCSIGKRECSYSGKYCTHTGRITEDDFYCKDAERSKS